VRFRFVTPDERHCGREHGILAQRHQLYQRARAENPERWSRATRDWTPIGLVVLNPPRADLQVGRLKPCDNYLDTHRESMIGDKAASFLGTAIPASLNLIVRAHHANPRCS